MLRDLALRFDELRSAASDHGEWLAFSLLVIETLMHEQAQLIELNRQLLAQKQSADLRGRVRVQTMSVNGLASLYQKVQSKLRLDELTRHDD